MLPLVQVYRNTQWNIVFSNLGDLTEYNTIWFTLAKRYDNDPDHHLAQISTRDGLVGYDASLPPPGTIIDNTDGSLDVTGDDNDKLHLILDDKLTKYFPITNLLHFAITGSIGADENNNHKVIAYSNKFQILNEVARILR